MVELMRDLRSVLTQSFEYWAKDESSIGENISLRIRTHRNLAQIGA